MFNLYLKRFSYLLFLVLFTVSVNAQNTGLEVGLLSGLNMTSLHGDNFKRYYDWHYSGLGAVHLKYSFSENISVVTDIGYESKGCKGVNLKLVDPNGNNLGSNYSFSFTYTYITVPLLFRYSHTGFPFFVNAGPYIGYLLNYAEEYKDTKLDRTSDMKKTDFGFTIGAGLCYPLSDKWNITGEIRNNLGLTNVWASYDAYKTAPFRPILNHNPVYTNSTNFLVGINYKL